MFDLQCCQPGYHSGMHGQPATYASDHLACELLQTSMLARQHEAGCLLYFFSPRKRADVMLVRRACQVHRQWSGHVYG
jgi:hypothetical protein